MKKQADKYRSERQFAGGDMVYVKLQPYRQALVTNRRCLKLSACFFSPYTILECIGEVAYKLDFSAEAKIHLVFHVS